MVRGELVKKASSIWLEHPVAKDGAQSSSVADEFWWSVMRGSGDGLDMRKNSSAATEPVCGKLRALFDDVASEPMPECLAALADRLERAFERGELFAPKPKR